MNQTATTQQFYISSASPSADHAVTRTPSANLRESRQNGARMEKAIEGAVYTHIRAVRALGRTTINTRDIAKALRLSISDVDKAVTRLNAKGVKIIA